MYCTHTRQALVIIYSPHFIGRWRQFDTKAGQRIFKVSGQSTVDVIVWPGTGHRSLMTKKNAQNKTSKYSKDPWSLTFSCQENSPGLGKSLETDINSFHSMHHSLRLIRMCPKVKRSEYPFNWSFVFNWPPIKAHILFKSYEHERMNDTWLVMLKHKRKMS